MIISASRRTDIPAFYSEWLFKRLEAGFAYVRNPMNFHQVSEIELSPNVVDCIVFWTKNPKPMLDRLELLSDYNYYFQFTLDPYSADVEPGVPSNGREVIGTFLELAAKIGADRVVWRYDPILISEKYSVEYHAKYFHRLAADLNGTFGKCVISFMDIYKKNAKRVTKSGIREPNEAEIFAIAETIAETAEKYGFAVSSCAEKIDLGGLGIGHNSCVDRDLIERLTGARLDVRKDKNQRGECCCVESVDIGAYNTCLHGCSYCYANFDEANVRFNHGLYDADSPLLCGVLSSDDKVTKREAKSLVDDQTRLL